MNTVFIIIICVLLVIGAFVGSCIAGQTFSSTSGEHGGPSASGQGTDTCSSCPYRKSQVIRIEVDPTPNKTEKHEQKDTYD